jgi:hypothetical protein
VWGFVCIGTCLGKPTCSSPIRCLAYHTCCPIKPQMVPQCNARGRLGNNHGFDQYQVPFSDTHSRIRTIKDGC